MSEFGSIGPNSKFYKGQLLYSKIRPSLNKAVIAPYNGLCSADMYPIETSINIEFMLRMILSEVFLSQVRREENRVKMPKLNLESLYAFLVPLPPLAEQKRIVAKIDQLMTLCDTLEKQRAERNKKRRTVHVSTLHHLLNASDKREFDNSWRFIRSHFDELYSVKENVVELKKAILSLAMQGKLVKQDPNDQPASELLKEIQAERERLVAEGKIKSQKPLPPITPEEVPYQVPSGWEWVRLCTIGEINPRNEYDDNEIAGFVPMPMIFSEYGKNHTFEARKWNEIKKGYTHFANGDIGLAKITPCFENGKSCIFNGLPNSVGAGTTELHIFRNTYNAIIPEYLLAYLKNPYYIRLGIKKMTGSAGQKRVPTDYFSFNPFPLPPLAEQKRIVAKIDQLMALCDTLERQICDATGKQTALLNAVVEKAKITHTKIYAIK